MGHPARKPVSYEDLEALPAGWVGEIIAGELYASPRPAAPHALASATLGIDLGNPFQRGRGGPGGWWILDEPELHLGEDVVVPDLAGWRRERLPQIPGDAFLTLEPDWVCEVLSPRTVQIDRAQKMPLYAAWGVPWAWLVDPLARTLEAFQLREGRWLLLGVWREDAVAPIAPFEAVPLELGALWGRL